MGKETGISWTDHTFNPWWGCMKVSPGCTNCYAEAFAKRAGEDEAWEFAEEHQLDLTQKYDDKGIQMRLDDLLPLYAHWIRARAAAPAERCIQCQAKIGSRHTDQCPQPGYVDETQVAVEPAPRPPAGFCCYAAKVSGTAEHNIWCKNAASSPVARPQENCVECGHFRNQHKADDDDCTVCGCSQFIKFEPAARPFKHLQQCASWQDGYACNCKNAVDEPAARVEQPTPRQEFPCADCGREQTDKIHLDSAGTHWGAALHWYKSPPAAPVVEQREFIVWQGEPLSVCMTCSAAIFDTALHTNWHSSQRTEGEPWTKKELEWTKLYMAMAECEECGFLNGKYRACVKHGYRDGAPAAGSPERLDAAQAIVAKFEADMEGRQFSLRPTIQFVIELKAALAGTDTDVAKGEVR